MARFAYTPSTMPAPTSIAMVDESVLLAAIKDAFTTRAAALGLDVSGIIDLEAEPGNIQLQVAAYREAILRSAINDAVKANLLAFAAGSDLDHLGVFYDAERLADEPDAAFRARIILAIKGRSPAGGADHYANAARRADERVADVAVYRAGTGPEVTVAILSTDNGGVADEELLDAVEAEVTRSDVRVVSDIVAVEAAVQTIQPVTANIWLLPTAPASIVTGLGAILDAAIVNEGGLGFDLTRSWLTAKLHVDGVQRVEIVAPAADVVVDGSHAVALGTKTLTFAGRAQ